MLRSRNRKGKNPLVLGRCASFHVYSLSLLSMTIKDQLQSPAVQSIGNKFSDDFKCVGKSIDLNYDSACGSLFNDSPSTTNRSNDT